MIIEIPILRKETKEESDVISGEIKYLDVPIGKGVYIFNLKDMNSYFHTDVDDGTFLAFDFGDISTTLSIEEFESLLFNKLSQTKDLKDRELDWFNHLSSKYGVKKLGKVNSSGI